MKCLTRALKTLDSATKLKHHVEVIVQGPLRKGARLPAEVLFKNIELKYFHNEENLGNAVPLVHSIKRFLKTDHAWWAKCDDDMSFERHGWDTAIRALKNEDRLKDYRCGCAMLAVPMPMFSARPRNFYEQKRAGNKVPLLKWHERGYVNRNLGGKPQYIVCDFADHGCTVFKRAIFEAGCMPDPYYFTGGIDFDLCWQMLQKGFKSILVTNPRSNHHHTECKPYEYGVIRYDPKQTNRSGRHFMKKWGLEIQFLTGFKGLPQYMPQKSGQKKVVAQKPSGIDWHRDAVAGRNWEETGVWDYVGELQRDFLISHGLKPNHKVLDVACGCFRAGVHFMKYLKDGNYYGLDKEKRLIDAGVRFELPRYKLQNAHPVLIVTDSFDLSSLDKNVRFHFAIAHSLFTHIVPSIIETCVKQVIPRLTQNGKFFATFHKSSDGQIDLSYELENFQSWRKNERHSTRYPFGFFQKIARKCGCKVKYIGDWGHPYNCKNRQLMIEFRR
jgi:hypothetical protein